MAIGVAARNHGWTVKATCFCGFFLLIAAAGTVGSAVVIQRQQTPRADWPRATGRVHGCKVWSFRPTFVIDGKSYALLCNISYPFQGRTYQNVLDSTFTRSQRVRAALTDWVARTGPESNLAVRINPKEPYRFTVDDPLPFHHGDNPDDFLWAALAMGATGAVLVAIGRRLIRAGW